MIKRNNGIYYENSREFFSAVKSERVSGRDRSSRSGDEDFTGTLDFDHAMKLLLGGDENGYREILKLKSRIDKYQSMFEKAKTRQFDDVVGYTPNVANAVMGLPKTMRNEQRTLKPQKMLNIFVNRSRAWFVEKEQIQYEGALILSFVEALEFQGFRVNLTVGQITHGDEGPLGHIVTIKKASEPLNIKKTAFYLMHPSYLRRIGFAILENESYLPNVTNRGYGRATRYDECEELAKDLLGDDNLITLDARSEYRIGNDEENIIKLSQLVK